ncbi:MAG: cation transporter [Eubacterium sp.]|nr:cation transporter [Eubacterium sp.]
MIRTTVQIEGMACGMCEAHIADTIRKIIPEAKKLKVSHKKGTAVFMTETGPDEEKLREAIAATGYGVQGIMQEPYEKHGLFG